MTSLDEASARLNGFIAGGLISEKDMSALRGGSDKPLEGLYVGEFPMPFSVATNFIVNGKDIVVPMAQEEASVVAAASNAAKAARVLGGFSGTVTKIPLVAKIVCRGCNPDAEQQILAQKLTIAEIVNQTVQQHIPASSQTETAATAAAHFVDLALSSSNGSTVCVGVLVNIDDVAVLEVVGRACVLCVLQACGGQLLCCTVPSTQPRMLAKVQGVWSNKEVCRKGEGAVGGVVDGWAFARADIFRATTHNKGIMNGIEAVVRATGNDSSAVEAVVHHGASSMPLAARYTSLTHYSITSTGDLAGSIVLMLPPLRIHHAQGTLASVGCSLLGVQSPEDLALALAAVGLAQNMAALWALATDGIQQGHMRLHANNVAVMGGAATESEIAAVVARMVEHNNVSVTNAQSILTQLRADLATESPSS